MIRMSRPSLASVRSHWQSAALLAVLLLGLATARIVHQDLAVLALVAAMLIIAVSWIAQEGNLGHGSVIVASTLTIVIFSATALFPRLEAQFWDSFPGHLRLAWAGVVLAAAATPAARGRRFQIAAGSIIIAMVSVAAIVYVSYMSGAETDVIAGHRAAAEVLEQGHNPYSDAVFPDSGPRYANVGDIVGYAYPPVTMIPYVVSEWLGEARWVGVGAMAAALFGVLWFGSLRPRLGLLLLGVGVTFPMLGAMYAHGWTEPLSLVLILAVAWMSGSGTPKGVTLGLALASKQYMVLTLVPMLTMRLSHRVRVLAVALATGMLVSLPFLLWNVEAFWHALVGSQIDRVARSDVLSVGAFGFRVPVLVCLAASVGVGLVLGRRVAGGWHLLLAQAATLAVYFATAANSFRNYWFMVAFMVLGAVGSSFRVSGDDGNGNRAGQQSDMRPVVNRAQLSGVSLRSSPPSPTWHGR